MAHQEGYTNPYTGNTWNNPISSYLDTVIRNQQQASFFRNQALSQMLFNQMVSDSVLRDSGNRRIRAGKASTRFTPSGSAPAVGSAPPATVRACLSDFHAAMTRFGLAPYDVADARALAFAMAFTAYRGQDPGPARVKWLRSRFRGAMLRDPMFQALPDSERQARYERMVVPAQMAVTARRQSTRSGLDSERRDVLIATAERLGESLLKGLWTDPVEAIELSPTGFVDRGERLASSGAGATTFRRSGKSAVVPEMGNNPTYQGFGWNEAYYAKLLERFDAAVRQLGLRTDDLADANVAGAAVIYPVLTEGKASLGAAQIAWLRREMRKDVLTSANLQRLSDGQKQDLYERIGLEAMHIRNQDETKRAEIARLSQKGGDPFTNIGNAGIVDADRRILESNRASARDLMKRIFAPRNFDEYVLSPDGFRKR